MVNILFFNTFMWLNRCILVNICIVIYQVHTDRRVKQVNELVHGIKVIKLLAWEDVFCKNIEDTRALEVHLLFPIMCIRGLIGERL